MLGLEREFIRGCKGWDGEYLSNKGRNMEIKRNRRQCRKKIKDKRMKDTKKIRNRRRKRGRSSRRGEGRGRGGKGREEEEEKEKEKRE